MGEAKKRGTLEQRQAEAVQRNQLRKREAQERVYMSVGQVVVSGQRRCPWVQTAQERQAQSPMQPQPTGG